MFNQEYGVTPEMEKEFRNQGYTIIRKLLDEEEVGKLKTAIEKDEEGLLKNTYGRDDGEGRRTKTVLWNYPGDDITGAIACSHKVAGNMEKLLGRGEIYHYHSKVIMKEPLTGGAHIWHQDYGYWYLNGCLLPDMGTVWIAIDKADVNNGCLKILPGSHMAGRIEHSHIGDQMGADMTRVNELMKVCQLKHVEVNAGDAIFFHCNLLHRSDQNSSPNRRWAFLVSFNTAGNNPVYEHHHPQYFKTNKVPNEDIKKFGTKLNPRGKGFFEGPKVDVSIAKFAEQQIKSQSQA